MTRSAPSIVKSKFFVPEPEWHMKEEAPDRMKALFEKQMNDEKNKFIWMLKKYEDMENPYICWNGEVINRK